jgi:hypothetical protein
VDPKLSYNNVNDKKKICSFIDPGELRIKTKK